MKANDDELDADPFLCRCCKCKKFWADHFNANNSQLLKDPPHLRALKSGCLYASVKKREDHPAVLKIGDRVLVHPDEHKGVVKYLGPLDENLVSPELYVGVQTDSQVNSVHNGIFNKKRYFHCPRGHGLMVKYGDVVRINPPEKKPPVKGNYMFPSFKQIRENRRARSLLDPELDLGPMYTASKSSRAGSAKSRTSTKSEEKTGGTLSAKQRERLEEQHDYTTEPPRDLIMRWSKERFGGGREGEIKARTLYKLQAAYQRGLQYRESETKACDSSSDESSDQEEEENPNGKPIAKLVQKRPTKT